MTTLEQVVGGIADRLSTIPGLRVFDTPAADIDGIGAVVMPPEMDYWDSAGDDSAYGFEIWLLVPATDTARGLKLFWPFLERTGPQSIRAAFEAQRNLGFVDVDAHVTGSRPLGVIEVGAVPKFGSALILPVSIAG